MSDDVATATMVDWTGISGDAQIFLALATMALAWVAYVAFVQDSATREKERKRDETREIVGALIGSLEDYVARLSQSTWVSVSKVPYLTKEAAQIEAAIGMARAYGHVELVDSASAYLQSARDWRRSILRAKRLRNEDVADKGRVPAYEKALKKSSSVFLERVRPRRDRFFTVCGELLKVPMSSSQEVSLADFGSQEDEAPK